MTFLARHESRRSDEIMMKRSGFQGSFGDRLLNLANGGVLLIKAMRIKGGGKIVYQIFRGSIAMIDDCENVVEFFFSTSSFVSLYSLLLRPFNS